MDVLFRGGALQIRLDKRADGVRLFDFLRHRLALPEGYSQKLCQSGQVTAGGRALSADEPLRTGMRLHISEREESANDDFSQTPIDASVSELLVLYEDEHLLVVNKPYGMIIHHEDVRQWTLDQAVLRYLWQSGSDGRAYHVHRLDRPTTGAVVYAKHGLIARALDAQLSTHRLARTYLAVVCGRLLPKQTDVVMPIGRDRHRAGYYLVSSTGKEARTHLSVQASCIEDTGQTCSLLRLRLETGRTHQIRVHTAALSAPIVGDEAYGGPLDIANWPPRGQIALHAARVQFYHPYEERDVMVDAPLDEGWRTFLWTKWKLKDETSLRE